MSKHVFSPAATLLRRAAALAAMALCSFGVQAQSVIKMSVDTTRLQHITGFGCANMWGAMLPISSDKVWVIDQLYGSDSPIGLNILRTEVSPNTVGDVNVGWDTPYDWHGTLPSVRRAKAKGAIIFAAPWSPPASFKTNNSTLGKTKEGKVGKLRRDYYGRFFSWLNSYLKYMSDNQASVDVISLQNEPDWTPGYSGCYYSPQDLDTLVALYGDRLQKQRFGVKLMSAEPLGYTQNYYAPTLNDPKARQYIDIVGGHLYGHEPLVFMKPVAAMARPYGIEAWMTEHTVNPREDTNGDSQGDVKMHYMPNWHEQLIFAEEVNEVLRSGGSAYVYWYMIDHVGFIGSGENAVGGDNTFGKVLDRAYVMSHFSKHLTGSVRLSSHSQVSEGSKAFEQSAYIKGDSLYIITIDTTRYAHTLRINVPWQLSSAKAIVSTEGQLCQERDLSVQTGGKTVDYAMPARRISTLVFAIDRTATGIRTLPPPGAAATVSMPVYTLQGARVPASRVNSLPPGVYVRGGRKFVVK